MQLVALFTLLHMDFNDFSSFQTVFNEMHATSFRFGVVLWAQSLIAPSGMKLLCHLAKLNELTPHIQRRGVPSPRWHGDGRHGMAGSRAAKVHGHAVLDEGIDIHFLLEVFRCL